MLEIPPEIYAWLVSIDILDDSTFDKSKAIENKLKYPQYPNLPSSVANFSFNENGTIKLNEEVLKTILTGFFFPNLFSKFNLMMNEIYGNIYKNDESLMQVINNETPQIKLHNWDLILESIKNYYGIIFDNNFKTLLIAGDNTTFNELFQKLYSFFIELQNRIEKENETKFLKENDQKNLEMPVFDNDKTKSLPKIRFNEDTIDLDELSNNNNIKPLNQTRSVLEFIICAICKSMNLNAKQSAALLSDNKKYLTHILTKGLSNKNFIPVKNFYTEVLSNIDYFIQLIQINSIAFPNQIIKNIELSLSTFKPGLLSKNIDIVYISGRLLSKLALELIESNLISAAYDWFISPNGGLETCILCLKKHDEVVEVVVNLINNFCRFHLYEFFTIHLKNFLQTDGAYFTFLSDIIEKFSRISNFTDEFSKNNLKAFFIEYIVEVSRSPNVNERIKSALLLGEIWVNLSIYFESESENYQILSIFKTLYKDKNHLVQYASLSQLFRVLLSFSSERNTFVPVIYKCLIFAFVENHNDILIRDFIISNFNYVFIFILSIPVGILVEPYDKQIQLNLGTSYYFNINDLTFLTTVARHPRFNVKEAVLTMDILGKIYFDIGKEEVIVNEAFKTNTYRGIYFYKVIKSLFTMILSRYLMHELGVQFCFKYVKMCIQTFCRLDRPLSDKIYTNALALNIHPEDNKEKLVFEEDVILNQKERKSYINFNALTKMVIVRMIQDILSINNIFINGAIKNLIITASLRHFKIYEFMNIGLSKMLSHFGNPNDVVYYYNINQDELEIDKEFKLAIDLIYDKLPELKEPIVDMNKEEDDNFNIILKGKKSETFKKQNSNILLKSANRKKNNLIDTLDNKSNKSEPMMNLNKSQITHLKNLKENLLTYEKSKKIIEKEIIPYHNKFSTYNKKTKKIKTEDLLYTKQNNNITLVDLNYEEDRDIIKLKKFLKDYSGFFKDVFQRYCGSIYHPMNGKVFNSIKEIGDTISPSEIIKIFKEHNIIGNYGLSKEDLLIILSIMNSRVFKKKSLRSGITYDEFMEDFIQISYYAFSKPPFVYKNYTISDYSEEMIRIFSKEFPENLKYYHPDKLLSNDEKEICSALNKQLKRSNFVHIPNGYKKYLDTDIYYKFYVPDCMYFLLGESKKICLEIVDEIICLVTKKHTLEGFVYVEENYKTRPIYPKKQYPKQNDNFFFDNEKFKVVKNRNRNVPYIVKGNESKKIQDNYKKKSNNNNGKEFFFLSKKE